MSNYDTACETCDEPQCEAPIGRIAEIGGLTKPVKPRVSESTLGDFLNLIKNEYLPTFRWTWTTKRFGSGRQVTMKYNFRDEWKDIDLGCTEAFLEDDVWKSREEFYYTVYKYVLDLIFDLRGKFEEQRKVH
jgi:hypothetical protein